MTGLFKELILVESQKRANSIVGYAISTINEVYNEWKKIHRRKNAVNIVATSVNKICTIDPDTIPQLHDIAKVKLAVIIMRCLDIPPWMEVETKRIAYRRLFPLLNKIQGVSPNTGTSGTLREVIATRLSASVGKHSDNPDVFVAYEPQITVKYMRYIFGDEVPSIVSKMQTLPLPEDFDVMIKTLKINHTKACEKYNQKEIKQ